MGNEVSQQTGAAAESGQGILLKKILVIAQSEAKAAEAE